MVCSGSRSGLVRDGSPPPARPSWTARASRPPNGGRHGYDGAKRLNGRKRHLLVDTLGLVIKVHLTAADVVTGAKPRFLGPPVPITGDSDASSG